MFRNIPNLRGTAPWVLFDFRSPFRCHQTYQNGWNRKGLVSDKGQRKMAWRVMKDFYDTK
jgi:beta-glucuronidase